MRRAGVLSREHTEWRDGLKPCFSDLTLLSERETMVSATFVFSSYVFLHLRRHLDSSMKPIEGKNHRKSNFNDKNNILTKKGIVRGRGRSIYKL